MGNIFWDTGAGGGRFGEQDGNIRSKRRAEGPWDEQNPEKEGKGHSKKGMGGGETTRKNKGRRAKTKSHRMIFDRNVKKSPIVGGGGGGEQN